MNGGQEFFSSLFGEFLVGRDCSTVLQDPNADPLDREVCSSLFQFQKQFIGENHSDDQSVRDSPLTEPDPQSLRDEILHREPSRFPRSHHQPDKDLDGHVTSDDLWGGKWFKDTPRNKESHYSSSTTITITQKPDGTYEEKRTTRDSKGKEEITTRIIEKDHKPFYKRPF